MNYLINALSRSGLLKDDLDDLLIRASMVIVFLLFGYQKWFEYEAKVLIPYVSNGPLISWMYPAFGIRGGSWFLGVMEWLICSLLFWGFWNKQVGILGAIGSCIRCDRDDHSIHAERLGSGCRGIPGNDWQRSFSHEGCGALCSIGLFAEAGCRKRDAFGGARRHHQLSDEVSCLDAGETRSSQRGS